MAHKLLPQSHSTMQMYLNCPHKYYRVKVAKDCKEDFSHPSALWGQDAHKALENRLRDGTELPDRFKQFRKYADRLASMKGVKFVERKLAVDADYNPSQFFDNDSLYRGVVDYLVIHEGVGYLIDHKTGKVKPNELEQLELAALMIFARFPTVSIVKGALTWLKHDDASRMQITRDEAHDIEQAKFFPIVQTMRASAQAENWPKKPSGLCPWCPVRDCENFKPR